MTAIRPLERADLEDVSSLVGANLKGWSRDAGILERNLFDHPSAPDVPRSLVAIGDDGALIGTIGAQARKLRFNRRACEAVCVSHLAVAEDRRAGAAGALLLRAVLGGDQELTWTESVTPRVARIWGVLGGDIDHARTCDWMLVLRPTTWLRRLSREMISPGGWIGPHVAPVRALPLPGGASDEYEGPVEEATSEDVAIADLAAEIPKFSGKINLMVDHDQTYLDYVFSYFDALGIEDRVVRRLVRLSGKPIGWYAYVMREDGARVIHVGAPAATAAVVTAALVGDARARGVAVLSGRLEPHLEEPIRRSGALLALRQRPIVHSHDPEILAAVASSKSLLTEIDLVDSIWW